MNGAQPSGRLSGAIRAAWRMRWFFLIVFLLVFFLSYSALLAVDLVPNPPSSANMQGTAGGTLTATPLVAQNASPLSPNVMDAFIVSEQPIRIEIPSIKLSASISNPTSTKVAILDAALMKGAVRYPTSALLGQKGNVILFGHSTYLPIVNSPAYKTFDGIEKLSPADTVTVYSSDRAYIYSVDSVEKKSTASDAIPLAVSDSELTLSTCDSFGLKSDRFVVTAHLVSTNAL